MKTYSYWPSSIEDLRHYLKGKKDDDFILVYRDIENGLWISYDFLQKKLYCSPKAWFILGKPDIRSMFCVTCGSTSTECLVNDRTLCDIGISIDFDIDRDD